VIDRELAKVIRHAQARAQLFDQRDAGVLVSMMRGQHFGWRGALAEVVHQHGEAHRDAATQAAAACRAISWCTPVSISGCHFSGCGTPNSASISGYTTRSAPQARST
jgi:hypothetical protein